MGRPVDWSEVFGFADPTPGDVFVVRQVGHRWGQVADAADFAEGKLRGWLRDDSVATWIGKAGEAFAAHSTELPDQLAKARDSYRKASDAMSWWAGRLDMHQGKADGALVRGREAKADLASAHAALSAAAGQVSSAGGAGPLNYHGAPDADLAPTPEQVSAATGRLHAAQAAQSHAQGLVHDAEARLAAARSMAVEAKGLRESDGRTTAGKVHDAADAGIKPRSRWQKFKDGVAKAWHVIVAIAKVVVLVLGVVALIIGGPLAWIVFAAALIVLADTLMKYAKGQATLLDVLLAAVSCIPGTKGLTTLGELSAAFKAGGLIGATGHVLGAAKTMVLGMAQGIRAMGPGLKTFVGHLLDSGLVRMDARFLTEGGASAEHWMSVRAGIHRLRGGDFTDSGNLIVHRWTPAGEAGPLGAGFPADTFRSASYDEVLLRHESTLNRVITEGGNPKGLFWTADAPSGPLESQLNLALKPEWNVETVNGVTHTLPQATHHIQADFPAGTTIFQGPTGVQVSTGLSGGHGVSIPGTMLGGGEQVIPHPYFMRQWQNAGAEADLGMNLTDARPVR